MIPKSPDVPRNGFTFIGVLTVMTVMMIAMGAIAQVWHTEMKRENEEELLFVGHQMRTAIAKYFRATGRYPASLEELTESPGIGTSSPVRYLRKIYRDPMTGDVQWGLAKNQNSVITGVYSLSELAPYKVAGFRDVDKEFEKAEKYSDWKFVFIPKLPTGQGLQGTFVNGYARPVPRLK